MIWGNALHIDEVFKNKLLFHRLEVKRFTASFCPQKRRGDSFRSSVFKSPKNEDAQIFTPTDRTRKSMCVFQRNPLQLSHKTDCLGKLYLKYEKPRLYFAKHRYKKIVKLNGSVT